MTAHSDTPDWSALPAPIGDGAARHLLRVRMASVPLPATDGRMIDLAATPGCVVVYAYPRTGRPDVPNPDGWDVIPGARGCNAQACAFRDHATELTGVGVDHVFGLSTQDSADQREAADRLHLPFPLLSDARLELTRAMSLPVFTVAGATLLRRFTLVIRDGVVEHVFYPVFPPDQNASDVINWLRDRT